MRLSRQALLLLTASASAFVLPARPALAQDKPEPGKGEPIVRLMPKDGGWTVLELFDTIHKATGISILFDNANATFKQAKVEFVGPHVIRESELFDWLQAVLSYRKLVLVPVGPKSPDGKQQWFVMDQADPNLKSRPVYIEEKDIFDYADRDGLYVVTTLTLKNITDTTRVRNALSPLSTQTAGIGRIQDIPGSKALIVGDFAPVVAAMKRLLAYIDITTNTDEPRLSLVNLEHEVASELAPILTELVQASVDPNNPNRLQQRQPGQPEEEPEPRIIADNRLDAVIIFATPKWELKIRDLIVKLDVPSRGRTHLHFRPLRHTDAGEMASLLDSIVNASASSSSGFSTRPASRSLTRNTVRNSTVASGGVNTGGNSTFNNAVEGAPVIIADPKSNSLIIQSSPSQWDEIEKLIARLDQSRPQVLIETSLVELKVDDTLRLGVELFSGDKNVVVDTDDDGTPDAITNDRSKFSNTSFGLSSLVTTDINGVAVPTGKSPADLAGLTAGIFKNGRLPIILNAFQSAGRGRILTQPSIVTNDNEKATITLTQERSFKETVRDSTNTSTDSFKQVEANTELSISPHISSDNYLRLEIQQEVSNFTSLGENGAPPNKTTRKVDTHVTLPDTYTVVLGGIILEDESSNVSKVPILGDIPILGFFFRQTADESHPTHLFLFVTPRILRDTQSFADYHKLTWEKKLLQDDLFESEVVFPSKNFRGPDVAPGARSTLQQLEDSGELDAGVLKAGPSEEERRKMAEDAARRLPAPGTPAEEPKGEQK